jgi:hypothetical protein
MLTSNYRADHLSGESPQPIGNDKAVGRGLLAKDLGDPVIKDFDQLNFRFHLSSLDPLMIPGQSSEEASIRGHELNMNVGRAAQSADIGQLEVVAAIHR